MKCPECEFESPPGMRFCGRCGHQFGAACPRCGFENRPDFNFCGQCAAPLHSMPPPPLTPAEDIADTGIAERRSVTVMFCDLVESTMLAGQLDPEEFSEVLLRYQQQVASSVERFSGYIAQYLGDGVLVYFGYPEAHEESARRAVSGGLAIIDGLVELNRELQENRHLRISVRIGIHTGLVVGGDVGAGGRTEQLVLGQTPNLAARLQNVATPDTVVLSRATYDQVAGFFDCAPLGPQQLKGSTEPMEAFRAIRPTGVRSRFHLAMAGGLAPMVGRRREGNRLLDAFAEVERGQGQLILITGEAGIGKSRLQQWLKEQVAARIDAWLSCCCLPYYRNTAWNPLIEMLEGQLGFEPDDDAATRWNKLEAGLIDWELFTPESAALLGNLLSLPPSEKFPATALNPPRLKQEILERLCALATRACAQRPAVLVIEDVHWADPSTLEFVGMLVERLPQYRLMIVLTHRSEVEVPAGFLARARRIMLERLHDFETESLIQEVSTGIPLPQDIRDEIVNHTDGVPLFVEELTKMILDSCLLKEASGAYVPTGRLRTLGIPLTLHDSLLSRLDQLGAAKEVAQTGSVIGRSFRYEVLAAVTGLDQTALHEHLERLVGASLLLQEGAPPEAAYSFKHALVQDAAYESLLRRRRRRLHQRVAEVFRGKFRDIGESEPEILAYHLEAGGLSHEAVPYLAIAAKRALGHSAYVEAIRHCEKGLELLSAFAGTLEHRGQELELLLSMGIALIATQGYAAESVERTYARAMEVCEELGDTPFEARYGIWAVAIVRADRESTGDLARWYQSLVADVDDPIIAMMAHSALGTWAFYRADFPMAAQHLTRSMELFDPGQHHAVTRQFAAGGAFFGYMVTTLYLWYTGAPEQARTHQQRVIAIAESLSDPYTLALALLYQANLWHALGDVDEVWAAVQRADRMLAASDHDFLFLAALIRLIRGWVLAQKGQVENGIAELQDGLTSLQATGAKILVPYYLSYLAEALLLSEDPAAALPIIDQAIDMSGRNLDQFYEPELERQKAELLWQIREDDAGAEKLLRKAVATASEQGSLSLELRAATTLGRLLAARGQLHEANATLSAVYQRFDEGYDTQDLTRARDLLQTWSAQCLVVQGAESGPV